MDVPQFCGIVDKAGNALLHPSSGSVLFHAPQCMASCSVKTHIPTELETGLKIRSRHFVLVALPTSEPN